MRILGARTHFLLVTKNVVHHEIDITENYIKYLHKEVMRFSEKDQWHLGEYKKHSNHVAAFDVDEKQIGIIFKTASPFETPALMKAQYTLSLWSLILSYAFWLFTLFRTAMGDYPES